jgi:hypothetical protein
MDETPSKPRRRWFRFRLRALLVVMMLAGPLLGLSYRAIWRACDQPKKVEFELFTRAHGNGMRSHFVESHVQSQDESTPRVNPGE